MRSSWRNWGLSAGGWIASQAVRGWMSTLDYRVRYDDPAADPALPECKGPMIYLFWHEYILFPLYLRGHCQLTMLLSKHRDADILEKVAYQLGFECVRGSTYQGAQTALRELTRRSQRRHLTITPDGPRGPRRTLARGAVYLSSQLQIPVVAMGFGYDRPRRLSSWDRFAIPRPFSRARAVVSHPIQVPAKLDRHGLEQHRQQIERQLCHLTNLAEEWAEGGHELPGARPLRRAGRQVADAEPRPAGNDPAPSPLSLPDSGDRDRSDAA